MGSRAARLAAPLLAAGLAVLAPVPSPAEEPVPDPGAAALLWLDARVADREWRKTPAALANEGSRKRVAGMLTAFLHSVDARDGAPRDGPHEALDALVGGGVGGGGVAAASFSSWMNGFAAVYLLEESLRAGAPHRSLPRLVRSIEDGQNAEGGWGHGRGPSAGFYPSTLVAATNLSLLALGLARDRGVEVEELALEDGIALIRAAQAPDGGLPYGGRRYLKGPEAGRTGGTVAAAAALGLAGEPLFLRAAAYFRRHAAAAPDGHASPAMHVFTGALAAWTLGDAAWKEYDDAVLARVRAARRGDGTLADIGRDSLEESPLMGSGETNRAYVTALHAAALAVPRSRIGRRLRELAGGGGGKAERATEPPLPPSPPLLWSAALPAGGQPLVGGDRVAVLDGEGRIHLLEGATGKVVGVVEADPGVRNRTALLTDGPVVVLSGPAQEIPDGASLSELLREMRGGDAEPRRVRAIAPDDGRLAWERELPGTVLAAAAGGGRLLLLGAGGKVTVLSLVDGSTSWEAEVEAGHVNTALLPLADGRVAVAAENRLTLLRGGGREAWRLRNPRRAGVTPEAWSALAPAPGGLFAGNTAGEVVRVNGEGRVLSRTALGSSVQALLTLPGPAEGVAALLSDGRVAAVEGGKVLWTLDAGAPPAVSGPRTLLGTAGGRLGVAAPSRGRLLWVDGGTGRVVAGLSISADARIGFGGAGVAVAGKEEVRLYGPPR